MAISSVTTYGNYIDLQASGSAGPGENPAEEGAIFLSGSAAGSGDSARFYFNSGLNAPELKLASSGVEVTTILDEDDMSSDSAAALATQQSIKAYVDAQVTAQDLDLAGDTGTLDIDLDSEALTIAGGTGLETAASDTTLTVSISDDGVDSDQIAAGAIDLAHMSANSVDSDQYVDGSIDTAHIADAQITLAKMAANSVDSDQYVDGSIDTAHLAADAVTNAKLADDAVDTENIADDAITAALIDDGAVGTAALATDAVTAAKLADSAVVTANIVDANVTTAKLAADAVTGAKIADASVDSEHLVDGSVDNAHLAGSIANGKLANSSITVTDGSSTTAISLGGSITFAGTSNEVEVGESSGTITVGLPDDVTIGQDLTVTRHLIVNGDQFKVDGETVVMNDTLMEMGTVGANNEAPSSTTTKDLGLVMHRHDGSSAKKIAIFWDESLDTFALNTDVSETDGVLTPSATGGGDLTLGSLNATGSISAQTEIEVGTLFKMPDNTSAKMLVADGTSYQEVAISGDVAMASNGAVTIQAGAVETSMLAADAVTGAKLADDAVDSEHILDGAIDLAHMSANSVDSDQYVDGSIDTAHLADDAVTNAKLAGSIANGKLANSTVELAQGAGMAAMGAVSLGGSVTVAVDGVLEDLDTLGAASSDGQFIVADGEGSFAYEDGNTARTSLGLGTGDSPTFTGLSVSGLTVGSFLFKNSEGAVASGPIALDANSDFNFMPSGGQSFHTGSLIVGVTGANLAGFSPSGHAIEVPNINSAAGRIKANAFVTYSARELKKDIKEISNPMTKLNALRPVTYNWRGTDVKSKGWKSEEVGFIADEVAEVLPQIVQRGLDGKAQGIDYSKLTAVLTQAVKNQDQEIQDLKAQLSKVLKALELKG